MEFLLTLLFGFIHTFSPPSDSLLAQIKRDGELWIVTRRHPAIYSVAEDRGESGLEYDLAKHFAQDLGVSLRVIVAQDFNDVFQILNKRQAHLAAAGLAASEEYKSLVRFGPAYQQVVPQVIFRQGNERPRNLDMLKRLGHNRVLAIGPEYLGLFERLKATYPELGWLTYDTADSLELAAQVDEQTADYAVVKSNEFKHLRTLYPELQVAFDLEGEQGLAWAFPRFAQDDSLYLAAIQFFNDLRRSGEMNQILDRYYGHIQHFDYVDVRAFHRHIETRLPLYLDQFQQSAAQHGLDWRLLAAISYQESRWEADAVSKTGVRGLMMLTKDTAERMGVADREDPTTSIEGGAKYFLLLKKELPEVVEEPDRTWLALAAYNVGYGHLLDARALTRRDGGDPNRWIDVRRHLPLLSQEEWVAQVRHGYARGHEAVQFVRNVRKFYDILLNRNDVAEVPRPAQPVERPATELSSLLK